MPADTCVGEQAGPSPLAGEKNTRDHLGSHHVQMLPVYVKHLRSFFVLHVFVPSPCRSSVWSRILRLLTFKCQARRQFWVPYRPKTGQTWFDCNVRHVSSTHLVDVSTIWIPRTRLHSLEMRVIGALFPASCVNPIAAQPLCQTQLLAMNLQQAPKVAEAILQMFGGPRPGKGGNPGAYHSAEVLEKALYKSMITQFEASQGVFCEDFISLVRQFLNSSNRFFLPLGALPFCAWKDRLLVAMIL